MKPIMCNRYSHCCPAFVLVLWLVFVPLIAAAEPFTGMVVGMAHIGFQGRNWSSLA
jgi:hypothetical protein